MRTRPSRWQSAQKFYPQWILDSDWRNACGSCTWSPLRMKSLLAGMLSPLLPVCFRPHGSLVNWGNGSPSEMLDDCFMATLPRTDIPSASVAVELAGLQSPKQYDAKPDLG